MSTPEMEELLQRAITHINAGEGDQGRALLEKILEQDPKNDRAWVWLSGCVEDPMQRRICLQQALSANPENQAALDGMRVLDGELMQASSGQPSLLDRRLSAISMGETAASMPGPQSAASPASPEEAALSPDLGQEPGEAAPGEEGKKRSPLRLVLLIVVGLLLLCVICGVLVNFVVPALVQGFNIQP